MTEFVQFPGFFLYSVCATHRAPGKKAAVPIYKVLVIIIIPFLVLTGRAFVIIAWRLLGCGNASCVWLSTGVALCVGWSGDRSQLVCQSNVSYFFLFGGTDLLVVLSHVNKLAVLCCAHNNT